MKLRKIIFRGQYLSFGSLFSKDNWLNLHFWIVVLLTTFIITLYYTWQEWFPWFWGYFVWVEYLNRAIGVTLFLIPLLYASIFVWWRGPVIISIIYLAMMTPFVSFYYVSFANMFSNFVLLILPVAIVIMVAILLERRKMQIEIAEEREEERQRYMTQIFQAQEDVKRRIALEIHDDAIQRLVAIATSAQQIILDSDNDEGAQHNIKKDIKWIRDNTVEVTNELRRIALALRPSILDNFGLTPAIRWLIGRLNKETRIKARISIEGHPINLCPEVEVNIFRIVQEALNNIRQHANASSTLITLSYTQDEVKLTIQDNGRGFTVDTIDNNIGSFISSGKLGIAGMRQRAASIASTFNIYSQKGGGTLISMDLRLSKS